MRGEGGEEGGRGGRRGEEGRDKYLIDLIRDGDFECPHVQCYVLRSKVVKVSKGGRGGEWGRGGRGEGNGREEERGRRRGGVKRRTYLLTPMMAPVTPGCFNSHASDN